MNNFIYYTPTKVFFGKKQEENLLEILKPYNPRKILLHYGRNAIKKMGLYDKIIRLLKQANIPYVELGGVEPNPKLSLVEQGIKLVKYEQIDFILAIGGGSVIDSAKSIAVGALVNHSPWLFQTHEKTPEAALPVGVILTISASGSDMSDSCVITNDETKEKRGFNHPLNRPKFAILNPELTYSVSAYQTACGIVDILMHTLERFIAQETEENPLTDSLAIGLLKSTIKAGKQAMENPYNYEARATLMWANSLSHNGLTSCGRPFVMAVHQLEHELSGMFDFIAHGAGLSALWCSYAMVAYPHAMNRFKRLSYEVFDIKPSANIQNDILEGILKFKKLFQELGMPTSLKEFNIPKESVTQLAKNVTFNHTRIIHDVIDIDEKTALKIYELAYE